MPHSQQNGTKQSVVDLGLGRFNESMAIVRLWLLAVLGLFTLLPAVAFSQAPGGSADNAELSGATMELAGSTSRRWILIRFEAFRGGCTESPDYRFAANRTVVISRCDEGRTVTSTVPWTIEQRGASDIVVRINGKAQELSFSKNGNTRLMRLRSPAVTRDQPTRDYIFQLAAD